MSELTLTLLRLGLLALLWIFIFSVVGVLRTDLYGTSVSRRSQRKAVREQERQQRRAAKEAKRAPAPAAAPAPARPRTVRPRAFEAGASGARRDGGPLDGHVPAAAGAGHPHRPQPGVCAGPRRRLRLRAPLPHLPGPSGREGWLVEDLGSTNGTFIGRDKLTSPQPVEVGTTLRIGKTVLEFRD